MSRHLWATYVWQRQSVAGLFPHNKVCLRCGRNDNIIDGESLDDGEDCDYVPHEPIDHDYSFRLIVTPAFARMLESAMKKVADE